MTLPTSSSTSNDEYIKQDDITEVQRLAQLGGLGDTIYDEEGPEDFNTFMEGLDIYVNTDVRRGDTGS